MCNDFKEAPKVNAKEAINKLCPADISPNLLISVSKASDYGKLKYGADKHGDYIHGDVKDFINAFLRHYIDWFTLGSMDEESGLHHAELMAWNIMAIIDILVKEGEITHNGSRKEIGK